MLDLKLSRNANASCRLAKLALCSCTSFVRYLTCTPLRLKYFESVRFFANKARCPYLSEPCHCSLRSSGTVWWLFSGRYCVLTTIVHSPPHRMPATNYSPYLRLKSRLLSTRSCFASAVKPGICYRFM